MVNSIGAIKNAGAIAHIHSTSVDGAAEGAGAVTGSRTRSPVHQGFRPTGSILAHIRHMQQPSSLPLRLLRSAVVALCGRDLAVPREPLHH